MYSGEQTTLLAFCNSTDKKKLFIVQVAQKKSDLILF